MYKVMKYSFRVIYYLYQEHIAKQIMASNLLKQTFR